MLLGSNGLQKLPLLCPPRPCGTRNTFSQVRLGDYVPEIALLRYLKHAEKPPECPRPTAALGKLALLLKETESQSISKAMLYLHNIDKRQEVETTVSSMNCCSSTWNGFISESFCTPIKSHKARHVSIAFTELLSESWIMPSEKAAASSR